MRQMLPESSLHSNEMAVCDSDAQAQEGRSPGYLNLAALTSLFLLWGFITGLNDVLVPHLKNVFELSYTRAVLVQFYFFTAYFLVSVPAGLLLRRVGYQLGLVFGLLVACAGCLVFIPAARLQIYEVFLLGLFVLASGITVLQVSANPYVIALGSAKTAPSRLNLTQAFNSLGTTLAPVAGGAVFFAAISMGADPDTATSVDEFRAREAALVEKPYFWLAVVLLMMVAFFSWIRLPAIPEHRLSHRTSPSHSTSPSRSETFSIWRFPRLTLGAIGIFAYVGAEVAIGSFLVSFFSESSVAEMQLFEAAKYVSYYWGGAMVGRFAGALLLRYVSAGKTLAVCSLGSVVLIGVAMLSSGYLAVWSIVAVGICNSIMFPTIFSLALRGLGQYTSQGSGILCMAIVGGAVIPLLQGVLADEAGIQISFLVPLLCYCYIAYYGAFSPTLRGAAME
ncbi:sugar MFS transporter [Microbulbifer variabilis]|uniref:Sugar MFS transporter n=1 Tax=Microbulbifer variabilis TaxID=266805 RepID=A0ABY4VJT6_9GAMM|nr:sugar MFS transporter [Microbulbifer variabilis]USD22727.1 sugar MFS transporter [Microbulbifer variabilis]